MDPHTWTRADIGCGLEDLLGARDDRDGWEEREREKERRERERERERERDSVKFVL